MHRLNHNETPYCSLGVLFLVLSCRHMNYNNSSDRQRIFLPFQNGYAPMHMAAEAGHVEVVKLLVESGASLRAESLVSNLSF